MKGSGLSGAWVFKAQRASTGAYLRNLNPCYEPGWRPSCLAQVRRVCTSLGGWSTSRSTLLQGRGSYACPRQESHKRTRLEAWASSADIGWGAYSLEAGWGQAWTAAVLALREQHTTLWNLTVKSRVAHHLPRLKS